MDKGKGGDRWGWLPAQMPGVAAQIAEKRRLWGAAHINECWHRGVVRLEPGWFFAREGALTVGTPSDDPVMANFAAANVTSTQSLLVMRAPEVDRGSH